MIKVKVSLYLIYLYCVEVYLLEVYTEVYLLEVYTCILWIYLKPLTRKKTELWNQLGSYSSWQRSGATPEALLKWLCRLQLLVCWDSKLGFQRGHIPLDASPQGVSPQQLFFWFPSNSHDSCPYLFIFFSPSYDKYSAHHHSKAIIYVSCHCYCPQAALGILLQYYNVFF